MTLFKRLWAELTRAWDWLTTTRVADDAGSGIEFSRDRWREDEDANWGDYPEDMADIDTGWPDYD